MFDLLDNELLFASVGRSGAFVNRPPGRRAVASFGRAARERRSSCGRRCPTAGNNQNTEQVFASLRPPGAGAFSARGGQRDAAAVAFDPATQRPAVVWISRIGGAPQTLRFAARTG